MDDTRMNEDVKSSSDANKDEFKSPGLLREFYDFLMWNKNWILVPMVIVLLLLAILIVIGSTTAAPFIYTVF